MHALLRQAQRQAPEEWNGTPMRPYCCAHACCGTQWGASARSATGVSPSGNLLKQLDSRSQSFTCVHTTSTVAGW
jgi:hypothetical protein